jgi:hypothetical protein
LDEEVPGEQGPFDPVAPACVVSLSEITWKVRAEPLMPQMHHSLVLGSCVSMHKIPAPRVRAPPHDHFPSPKLSQLGRLWLWRHRDATSRIDFLIYSSNESLLVVYAHSSP